MADARYFLADQPESRELYSKEQLRAMFFSGELRRSDMVVDDTTGLAHILGDLLSRAASAPLSPEDKPVETTRETRLRPPAPEQRYTEIRADTEVLAPAEDDASHASRYEEHDDEPVAQPVETFEPSEEEILWANDAEQAEHPPDNTEFLLHKFHPSWLSYPKTLLAVLIFGSLAVFFHRSHGDLSYVVVAVSICIFCLINASLDRSTTDYYITTRRVESEYGILGRNSNEVRVQDIRAIDVRMSGFCALLGVGTVDFSSSGGASVEVQFKNVRNPHRIKRIVRELQG